MQRNELIDKYIVLLNKWNKRMNLVQKNSLKDVYARHIKDSLQIEDFLCKGDYIIDIGSGAGFPGVILSICGFKNLVLCEKNAKKCIFLKSVKHELNLDYKVYHGDVYAFKNPGESNSVAVSRAFGSILKLLDVMDKLEIKKGVFHKGENFLKEIDEAKEAFEFKYELAKSITNPKSVIIKIFDIMRK